MLVNWQPVEEDLVGGMYTATRAGTYTPVLIVGLGGSGIKTLRFLKAVLLRHKAQFVQLLGIDSDNSENTKWPHLPQLSQAEHVILDQAIATQVLARAAAGESEEQHVLRYLPRRMGEVDIHAEVKRKIAAQKGAGQFRRAGRLLFQANVNGGTNVMGRLTNIRQSMQGLAKVIQQQGEGRIIAPGANIYVVSSLAGGTGAGVLLDCLALLRSLFTGDQDSITAFCFLPGELLDRELRNPQKERAVTRGNSVALLRELQAFDQGQMERYTFQLDGKTRVGPFAPFVNDIYLIGDRSAAGTTANSYVELTHALAHFLYAFVGAGVGATAEAGAINGQIPMETRRAEVPGVFNSLGIGTLEYPIPELAVYAVRASLSEWLARWSKARTTATEAQAAIDAFLTSDPLSLASAETFFARLLPPEEDLRRRVRFLQDAALRKNFLRQPDDTFVTQGLNRVNEVDSLLHSMTDTFRANAERWQQAVAQRTEAWVLERTRGALHEGARHLELLTKRLESFAAKLNTDRERRKSAMERLRHEMERDATRIHFWGFGLDAGIRKRFLDKVDQYLDVKIKAAADSSAESCLTELRNIISTLRSRLEVLQNNATAWAKDNERELLRIAQQADVPGFIQRVISYADFPKWTREHAVKVPDLQLPGLSWDQVLDAAFQSIKTDIDTALSGLDIVRDAARDGALRKRIATLNVASVPMIHPTDSAPLMQNMSPQKFVAGCLQTDDPFIAAHFPPPSSKATSTPVPTDNPHLVACAQTCHGFGAAHWRGFAESEAYYRDNPWYYHALEKHESLPPLQQLAAQESERLRLFGLGLMFELILVRGSHYYRNMLTSPRDQMSYFLVSAATRSAPATALRSTDLIQEPVIAQKRSKADDKLGDSLESALDNFASPRHASFGQQLADLVDDFKINQGAQALATLITAYAANDLSKQIAKADQRRDLLEQMGEALRAYAGTLA